MLSCNKSELLCRTIGTIHKARMLMSTTIAKVACPMNYERRIMMTFTFDFIILILKHKITCPLINSNNVTEILYMSCYFLYNFDYRLAVLETISNMC